VEVLWLLIIILRFFGILGIFGDFLGIFGGFLNEVLGFSKSLGETFFDRFFFCFE
jgi:hypothetical protein